MAQGISVRRRATKGAMSDLKAILAPRSLDYARAEARLDSSQDFDARKAVI